MSDKYTQKENFCTEWGSIYNKQESPPALTCKRHTDRGIASPRYAVLVGGGGVPTPGRGGVPTPGGGVPTPGGGGVPTPGGGVPTPGKGVVPTKVGTPPPSGR